MKKVTELGDKEVIHCRTREEADKIAELKGTYNGDCWDYHKEQSCFEGGDSYFYDSRRSYEYRGYTIYPASYFLEPEEEFRNGDKVDVKGFFNGVEYVNEWEGGGVYIGEHPDGRCVVMTEYNKINIVDKDKVRKSKQDPKKYYVNVYNPGNSVITGNVYDSEKEAKEAKEKSGYEHIYIKTISFEL